MQLFEDRLKISMDGLLMSNEASLILGIESSCDETSAAVIQGNKVLSNIVISQIKLHAEYGGVVPELASREHIKAIIPVIRIALKEAGITVDDISGIAVTKGPGLLGSLIVGVQVAKSIAVSRGIPFIGVNHLEGHILSPFLIFKEDFKVESPEFPFICLLVSGGHTMLIKVERFGKYHIIGQTRDDAVGECYDKVAKVLGLGYPGGPIIDKLSQEGDENAIKFPQSLRQRDNFDFSFSGIKTAVALLVKEQRENLSAALIKDISASFQKSVIEILLYKSLNALKRYKIKRLVITGGVSANQALRKEAKKLSEEYNFKLFLPSLLACTDNGAMIAYTGYLYLRKGIKDDINLSPSPNLGI